MDFKIRRYFLLAAAALMMFGCATPQTQMKKAIKGIEVKSTPEVLAVKNNRIDVSVFISFPEGYFDRNTLMVITPVIVYAGGQRTGKAFIYQGEAVMANYKVVPVGGITHRENLSFDFVPGMEQCHLELRCTLVYGNSKMVLTPIKVADGTNATYRLVQVSGEYSVKPDGYERVTHHSTEASIMFDVNSSEIRNTAKNRGAVSVYKSYLSDIQGNERYKVTGTEIVAYASPEGGEEYNAALSDKRAVSATKAWDDMSKGMGADSVTVKSIGQDWEGFKEALENSDIEDKDLILRVLSMYSDPAVRESEIKNLSFIYDELKTEVFPGLRRASFVVNAEHTGYSDAELLELAEKHLSLLTEPEVLHLASIEQDKGLKKYYYRFASQKFLSYVAYYNLAVLSLDENKNDVAMTYLEKVPEDADVLNAKGVVELRKGNYADARNWFLRSGSADAHKNLGTLQILDGEYSEAAKTLEGSGSDNEVLAYILDGQIDKAISAARLDTPRDAYIAAVAFARKGDAAGVQTALSKAKISEFYAEKALKDVEFVNYR